MAEDYHQRGWEKEHEQVERLFKATGIFEVMRLVVTSLSEGVNKVGDLNQIRLRNTYPDQEDCQFILRAFRYALTKVIKLV